MSSNITQDIELSLASLRIDTSKMKSENISSFGRFRYNRGRATVEVIGSRSAGGKNLKRMPAPRKEYMETIEKLRGFLSFPENWDSYAAARITKESVEEAASVFTKMISQLEMLGKKLEMPSVIPLPSGGIQLEWFTERGELEVEFHGNNRFLLLYTDSETRNEEELEDADLATVMGYLLRLHGEGRYV